MEVHNRNTGPSQGLKIQGARSTVVQGVDSSKENSWSGRLAVLGIICPLVEIGIRVQPKTAPPRCAIALEHILLVNSINYRLGKVIFDIPFMIQSHAKV